MAGCRLGRRRRAALRGYQHLLLLDGDAVAGHVPVPWLTERDWDICLLANGGGPVQALGFSPNGTLAGLAVGVHERAYKRLLADLPATTRQPTVQRQLIITTTRRQR